MARDYDSTDDVSRRTVLRKTGAVAAGAGAFSAGASATGNGNGKAKGRDTDEARGKPHGAGPAENDDEGGPGGPPFLEPTHDGIVFCGCSQVCVCVLPGPRETGKVRLESGDCVDIGEGDCYWGEKIVAIEADDGDGGTLRVCNPNTACAGTVASECDEVGTAPQFGEKCGEAFLTEHGH